MTHSPDIMSLRGSCQSVCGDPHKPMGAKPCCQRPPVPALIAAGVTPAAAIPLSPSAAVGSDEFEAAYQAALAGQFGIAAINK